MRKKIAIALLLLGIFVLEVPIASASNGRMPSQATPSSRPGFFQKINNFRLKFQDTFRNEYKNQQQIASKSEGFRLEIQNRLAEAKKLQLRNWWTRTTKRLNMIISRLNKIADRIGTRIDKFAADGRNMDTQRTELADARSKIDVATQTVASVSLQIDNILNNNVPTDAFRKLHELQLEVFARIREAHRALVQVLVSLRNAVTP